MTAHDKQLLDKCFKMTKKGKNTIPKGLHRSKEETDREIALRVAPELKPATVDKKAIHTLNKKVIEKIKEKGIAVYCDSKPSPKEGIVMATGSTRNELMETCKQKGVKNFRVLNKQEMTDILKNIGDQKYIDIVVEGAVRRWKSGWGKLNREAGKDHKE